MCGVYRLTLRENECQWIGNVRICISWARGGKVILGMPLLDECGPLVDDEGLQRWATALRDTITSMQRQDGAT